MQYIRLLFIFVFLFNSLFVLIHLILDSDAVNGK